MCDNVYRPAIVFPASAGMILDQDAESSQTRGVPRECGDDPLAQQKEGQEVQCSPRVRG